jgi:sulfur-carrier protein adenylyltransferase/sulfurtransferase
MKLTSANALELFREFDIVADGTDNFPTRYLVNDACVLTGKPNVYGSIFRFEGQASVFATEDGPCYRCLYPEPPPPGLVPSCAEGGVLGILPGTGRRDSGDRDHQADSGARRFACRTIAAGRCAGHEVPRTEAAQESRLPVCGTHRTITELIDYDQFCGIRGQEEPAGNDMPAISVEELKKKLDAKADVFILDVREPHEYQICNLKGYLIPLGDLPKRVNELDPAARSWPIVRWADAALRRWLSCGAPGFTKVYNLDRRNYLAWADRIDPKMPKY